MLVGLLRVLVAIFYPPCTPRGRQDRIEPNTKGIRAMFIRID